MTRLALAIAAALLTACAADSRPGPNAAPDGGQDAAVEPQDDAGTAADSGIDCAKHVNASGQTVYDCGNAPMEYIKCVVDTAKTGADYSLVYEWIVTSAGGFGVVCSIGQTHAQSTDPNGHCVVTEPGGDTYDFSFDHATKTLAEREFTAPGGMWLDTETVSAASGGCK